jgi:hypothetical protein
LIVKIRTKKTKSTNNSENKNNKVKKSKTSLSLELIYSDEEPISFNKLFIRTLLVSISDFIAQFSFFLFYLYTDIGSIKLDLIIIFKILSIYLFSRLLLNTFFHKHHKLCFYIDFICLIMLGAVDVYNIYPKWSLNVFFYLLVQILNSFCYSFEDVIGKKALIEEFLSPYKILLYKGVYELVILVFFSIPFFFIKIEDQNVFYVFIVTLSSFKNVGLVLLLMISNFAFNVFLWIIIERFSPNDLAMIMAVEELTNRIAILIFDFNKIKEELASYFYELFFYFIIMIGACIHSEIIILYCCNLNEYTKKNIDIKGQKDFHFANSGVSHRPSVCSETQDINERDTKDYIMAEMFFTSSVYSSFFKQYIISHWPCQICMCQLCPYLSRQYMPTDVVKALMHNLL